MTDFLSLSINLQDIGCSFFAFSSKYNYMLYAFSPVCEKWIQVKCVGKWHEIYSCGRSFSFPLEPFSCLSFPSGPFFSFYSTNPLASSLPFTIKRLSDYKLGNKPLCRFVVYLYRMYVTEHSECTCPNTAPLFSTSSWIQLNLDIHFRDQ